MGEERWGGMDKGFMGELAFGGEGTYGQEETGRGPPRRKETPEQRQVAGEHGTQQLVTDKSNSKSDGKGKLASGTERLECPV